MTDPRSEAQVVLRLDNITKRFGKLTANDAISFDLRQGEVIALLGENGAGKTTLMNILFGHYTPDEGHVEVFGQRLPAGNPRAALAAGVGMVHQHFTLADNMTVLENIVLGTRSIWRPGFGRAQARQRVVALMEDYGLRVDPDAQVGSLSVGERQRVEILKALYREARILILDEPTAVLTPQETDDLFATMRKAVALGLSVIFISHKLHEVMAISSRVVVLRHGKLVAEAKTAETDRAAMAQMMVGSEVAAPVVRRADPGAALVTLSDVSTPDSGSAPGLKNVDLELRAGQITGLAGVSGNGQTALADLIGGLIRPASGTFHVKGDAPRSWSPHAAISAGIARIPEDRHKTGTIADFDLTENAVLELYSRPGFSRHGWMNWRAASRPRASLRRPRASNHPSRRGISTLGQRSWITSTPRASALAAATALVIPICIQIVSRSGKAASASSTTGGTSSERRKMSTICTGGSISARVATMVLPKTSLPACMGFTGTTS